MNEAINVFASVVYDPSFIGALTGAVITGGLALYINSLERNRAREKEIEESKKVLLVIQHLSKDLNSSILEVLNNVEEHKKIKNPLSGNKTFVNEEGDELFEYFPPDEETESYGMKTKPFRQKIIAMSKEALDIYGMIEQVNINSLRLKEYDSILKFKSEFKKSVEPKLQKLNATGYPILNSQDLEVIKVVSQSLFNITK